MARYKPPSDELLKKAARLRAGGLSYTAVGKEVGRTPAAIQRWPELYRAKWNMYYAIAEQEILAEASAESVHVLRQQLRSKDERSRRDAAGKLIRTKSAVESNDPPISSEILAIAQYLEGLSDADLDTLAMQLAPKLGFTRIASDGGADPPPSAA